MSPGPNTVLLQQDANSPLQLTESPFAPELRPGLAVLACAPSGWDRLPPPSWPRVPGAASALRDAEERIWLCSGFLPCGTCAACQLGMHLACTSPTRPGWNAPGALAARSAVPTAFLAPMLDKGRLPEKVALIAAAGLTYQAQVMAGMVPGDAVLVLGPAGPGALPLQVLSASGLRPVWISPSASADGLPRGIEARTELPPAQELPAARCHLLDLAPSPASTLAWSPLAGSLLSATLLLGDWLRDGAAPLAPPLARILAGQLTLRCVRDLHPHLLLDLSALVDTDRVTISPHVEQLSWGTFPAAYARLMRGEADRWPVLCL